MNRVIIKSKIKTDCFYQHKTHLHISPSVGKNLEVLISITRQQVYMENYCAIYKSYMIEKYTTSVYIQYHYGHCMLVYIQSSAGNDIEYRKQYENSILHKVHCWGPVLVNSNRWRQYWDIFPLRRGSRNSQTFQIICLASIRARISYIIH